MRPSKSSLVLHSLVLLPVACAGTAVDRTGAGGAAPTPSAVPSAATRGADGGGLGPIVGTPAGAALEVELTVGGIVRTGSQVETCGACADLTVIVSGGNPPYSLAWSDPATTGRGPVRLCPKSVTDYSVTVSDTATGGEFGHPRSLKTVSVRVDPKGCNDPRPTDAGSGPTPILHTDGGVPPVRDTGVPVDPPGLVGICPCSAATSIPNDYLTNGSFEGPPGTSVTPPDWVACAGLPDLLPAPGALLRGPAPAGATQGSTFLGLSTTQSVSQGLKQRLRAGQRYWLSWDNVYTASAFSSSQIVGLVRVWGGDVTCQSTEILFEEGFQSTSTTPWWHTCAEFVPSADYQTLTFGTLLAGSLGSSYVSIDNLRLVAYEPAPTQPAWSSCAHLPVETPFP